MNLENIYNLMIQGKKPTVSKPLQKRFISLNETYNKVNEATLSIKFDQNDDKDTFQQEIDDKLANKIKNLYYSEIENFSYYCQNWLVSANWWTNKNEFLITDFTKKNIKIDKLTLFLESIIKQSLGDSLDIKRVIQDIKNITSLKNSKQLNIFSNLIKQKDKTKYSLKNIIKNIPNPPETQSIFAEHEQSILNHLLPVAAQQGVGPGELFFTCFTEVEKNKTKEGDFLIPTTGEVIEAKYTNGRLGDVILNLEYIEKKDSSITKAAIAAEYEKINKNEISRIKIKKYKIRSTTPESIYASYKKYKQSTELNQTPDIKDSPWKDIENLQNEDKDIEKLLHSLNNIYNLEDESKKDPIDKYFASKISKQGIQDEALYKVIDIITSNKFNYDFQIEEVIELFKDPTKPPHKILAALQLTKYIETKKFNYFLVFNTNEYMFLNCNEIKSKLESNDNSIKYEAFLDALNFILLPNIHITPAFDRGGFKISLK